MKHFEIECKWDANTPRAFYLAACALQNLCRRTVKPRTLHIKDTYLDNTKHDLSKQHIALRVRNTDGKWEVTFKTRTEIKNGKAIRREETLSLPQVKTSAQALRTLAQKKHWKGIATTDLCVQFTLANTRRLYTFDYSTSRLEMALDRVTIHVAGRRVFMQEIELELKQGKTKTLDQFAQLFTQQTNLKHTRISKVKTAESLRKLWKN